MMKNSKKNFKKYMKALKNQVRVKGWGQVRLGSKLYRDGENILVLYCQMNTLLNTKAGNLHFYFALHFVNFSVNNFSKLKRYPIDIYD